MLQTISIFNVFLFKNSRLLCFETKPGGERFRVFSYLVLTQYISAETETEDCTPAWAVPVIELEKTEIYRLTDQLNIF